MRRKGRPAKVIIKEYETTYRDLHQREVKVTALGGGWYEVFAQASRLSGLEVDLEIMRTTLRSKVERTLARDESKLPPDRHLDEYFR